MEIINLCNAAAVHDRAVTENEKAAYIAAHTKHGLLLERTSRFGEAYAIVFVQENKMIMSVPEANIIMKGENDNE